MRQRTGLSTQPDPIGLAGGLNLYGYANGDPINFHNAFGLSANVVYESEELRRLFQQLRQESAAFDAQLTSMEKSSVVTTVVEAASFNGTSVLGGAVFPGDFSGGMLESQTLVINSGSINTARRLFNATGLGPLDIKDVIGHEAGHAGAHARTRTWNSCADGIGLTCSVRAENAVRSDRGRPIRPRY